MRGMRETIVEVLKEGVKTPKELREQTEKRVSEMHGNFSAKNYYYHLKKLVDGGVVKKIPRTYELIKEETDEVRLEVQECTRVLQNKEEHAEVLRSRIRRLRLLSQNYRIASPKVIETLEECLENPRIIDNPESFEELAKLLTNILSYERGRIPALILKTTNGILNKIIEVLKRKLEFPSNYTIGFLCKSGKKEAVDLLFDKIREFKHGLTSEQIEMAGYHMRAVRNPVQLKIINGNIDGLIRDDDERLKEIGKKLDELISWRLIEK